MIGDTSFERKAVLLIVILVSLVMGGLAAVGFAGLIGL